MIWHDMFIDVCGEKTGVHPVRALHFIHCPCDECVEMSLAIANELA